MTEKLKCIRCGSNQIELVGGDNSRHCLDCGNAWGRATELEIRIEELEGQLVLCGQEIAQILAEFPKWISVEEGTPKGDDIVFNIGLDIHVGYFHKKGVWWSDNCGYFVHGVKWWTKLPKLPTDKESLQVEKGGAE